MFVEYRLEKEKKKSKKEKEGRKREEGWKLVSWEEGRAMDIIRNKEIAPLVPPKDRYMPISEICGFWSASRTELSTRLSSSSSAWLRTCSSPICSAVRVQILEKQM